jgi:dolichyl-phosphate-mannose-protein mannosyltransferase
VEGDSADGVLGSGDRSGKAAASGTALATPDLKTILMVVLALLAVTLLLRLPSFQRAPIEEDESLYLIMAYHWLQGGLPYVAVWDHHPIGVPALFALSQLVLGPDVIVVRILAAAFVWATALLLYWLVRSGEGSVSAALAAGLFYVAYTVVDGGLAANTEIFFIPFIVFGFAILLGEGRRLVNTGRARFGPAAAAGLAFGIGVQAKYVIVFEALAPILALTWLALQHNAGRGRIAVMVVLFGAAAAMPTAAVGAYFAATGHFAEFFQANFLANLSYLTMTALDKDGIPVASLLSCERALLPLVPIMAIVGLSTYYQRERVSAPSAALKSCANGIVVWSWLWVGAAALDVILPRKFYAHYFLVLVAPLSILSAVGLEKLAAVFCDARHRAAGFAIAVVAVMWLPAAGQVTPGLRALRELGLIGNVGTAIRDVSTIAADHIRANLDPGASIYVANDEPSIYLLSGATIPTRFAFPNDLTSAFGQDLPVDPLAEIRRIFDTKPQFVVRRRAPRVGEPRPALALIDTFLAGDYQRDCILIRADTHSLGLVEIYRRTPHPAVAEQSFEFCK